VKLSACLHKIDRTLNEQLDPLMAKFHFVDSSPVWMGEESAEFETEDGRTAAYGTNGVTTRQ
jgi:hypothetical protein